VNWLTGLVAEAKDNLYSSAINYAKMESLIEIDYIERRSMQLRPGKGSPLLMQYFGQDFYIWKPKTKLSD